MKHIDAATIKRLHSGDSLKELAANITNGNRLVKTCRYFKYCVEDIPALEERISVYRELIQEKMKEQDVYEQL